MNLNLLLQRPALVLAAFALLTGVLGWQARNFQIDASAETLLADNNRHYIQTQIIQQRFSPQEFLLVAYRPRDRALLSEQSFADLKSLSDELNTLDRVDSVRSIINVPLFLAAHGSLDADPALYTIERAHFAIKDISRSLKGHPIYENLLVNAEQTAAAIQVLFKADPELQNLHQQQVTLRQKLLDQDQLSTEDQKRLDALRAQAAPLERALDKRRHDEVAQIREIATHYEDDADVYLGGAHVLAFQLIEIISHDLVLFGLAVAGMICILLWLAFRSWRWVLIPMLCCISSVLITMGLFGMLDFKATVISSNFVALQLILTLAIVVHLIVQYREEMQLCPQAPHAELIDQTLQSKTRPCMYAGVTTAVGFAALLLSGIQPVMAFGWMMMVAMLVSIVTGLVLFPALTLLFGQSPQKADTAWLKAAMQGCVHLASRRPTAVFLISGVLLVFSVLGLLRLDVENSFINYFRDSTQVHQELAFIDKELGGSTALDIVYDIPQSQQRDDLVMTADTVQLMQRVQKAVTQHLGVGKTLSVVNFTELARELNGNRPLTEYELSTIYWTLDKQVRDGLVGAFFSEPHEQLRIGLRIQDTTANLNRAELLKDIRQDLADLGLSETQYSMSNLFVLYQDLLQRLYKAQILTLGFVYLMLGAAFLLIFRSLRIALIALVPNILSTLSILGVMGWAGIPLDFMTITISSIAMGIAVDDSIHYIHRFRAEQAKEAGADTAGVMARSHASVGIAILYTSLIIAMGFSLMGLSDFMPSVLFGLLTALAMVLALISDLILLPVLLARFAPSLDKKSSYIGKVAH